MKNRKKESTLKTKKETDPKVLEEGKGKATSA